MTEHWVSRQGVRLFVREAGSPDGAPVVLAHALGVDHSIWDEVVACLPQNLRVIMPDMRGHGLSDVPPPPYSMGALVTDAEAICDALEVKDCVFVGLSIGGMIAQGLSVKRLDLIRGLVLSNTAAKIGSPAQWRERIDTVKQNGVVALADATIERWFSKDFRASGRHVHWRDKLIACDANGYAGCAEAIAGTDFYTPTSGLRLPTLGIAGSEDGSTPPDLVRETVDLIPGSQFSLMRRVGHIPCVEDPMGYAARLSEFMRSIGHI